MKNRLEKIMNSSLLSNFPTFEQIAEGLNPQLLKDFATFYEESKFGLELIIEDLSQVTKNTNILEIGSGIGLLSQYLASKGYRVTSIEPGGQGFGMMSNLQEHVSKYFGLTNSNFIFHHSTIEEFNPNSKYGYIISINVFEHIKDPFQGLRITKSLLEEGGFARIITPNYAVPYEPHFHVPIFFSKELTFVIFRPRILNFKCFDPVGLWDSLNWISIDKVQRMLISESIPYSLSLRATQMYFQRFEGQNQFVARKGQFFKFFAINLKFLLKFLPQRLYPILDLTVIKPN